MKKVILVLFVILTLCGPAFSAPSITSVGGTVSNGNSITIGGTGFGSKSTAAPDIWDTVDNAGYSVTDGQVIPDGSPYPWSTNYNSTIKMETTDTMRRSDSSKMYKGTYTAGQDGDVYGPRFDQQNLTNPTGTIYVAWWFKYSGRDLTLGVDGHSSKFIRLSDRSDYLNLTFSWTQMNQYVYINGCYGDAIDENNFTVGQNTWALMEAYMYGTTETWAVYANGVLNANGNWSSCATVRFDQICAIGWHAGGAPTIPSEVIWMDDIYVDNTLARVFLASQGGSCTGTAPTYANCLTRAREIQIPSAWSTTSIAATVNQGALATSSNAYLFVIDSANAASTGYPVTLGSGGGDTTAPTVTITTNGGSNFSTSSSSASLAGTASDNVLVSSVSWACATCTPTSGSASGTTSWTISSIGLASGANTITVTATDSSSNTGNDSIVATRVPQTAKGLKLQGGAYK